LINLRACGKYRVFVFSVTLLFFGTCLAPISMTQTVNQNNIQNALISEGQILFAPMQSKTTYLINADGSVNHTWSSSYTPGESVYMLQDGTIVRTIKLSYQGGGAGGGVQKITWDGTLIWDFRYYTNDYSSHHDIELLPNGNILMIAWEYYTRAEAIAQGKDPNKIGSNTWSDHIIEVKPTGPSSGEIVWEWHVWDHLIQDYDPLKPNYGVVADYPELIDLNFGSTNRDWLHTNSIDYNEEFDQILVSVRTFNEIWVIDHSTTTEEAAGHAGGNSGKGGDLLYRWGNPQSYDAGFSTDREFYGQHDATWVEPGYPGEGNIMVFNNGGGRPGPDYTSIDEIVPPVDEYGNYAYTPGNSYGPEEQIWVYDCNFYAYYIGGAQRIPNGNTLICNGPGGEFIEVTPSGVIVWDYENQYPNPLNNNVFKVQYYPPEEPPPPDEPNLDCSGSFNWIDIQAGSTLYGSFEVDNIGDSGSLLDWKIVSYPDWGDWSFDPELGEDLTPEDGSEIIDVTVTIPNIMNIELEGYIRVENQKDSEDYDVIPVYLKTPRSKISDLRISDFLNKHQNLFPMLRLLLQFPRLFTFS